MTAIESIFHSIWTVGLTAGAILFVFFVVVVLCFYLTVK